MADVDVKKVKDLMAKKDAIEEEIKELSEVLESQKGVGMHQKLVDEDDYPRSDIDVYSVRTARHRIICLQNDHKKIMKQIEEGLHKIHATARERKQENLEEKPAANQADLEQKPFLKVNSVAAGSPASIAGLKVGDLVLKFGSLNLGNFQDMKNIATTVEHSQGRPMNIRVQRNDQTLSLTLTPNTWEGRGLLGYCAHLVGGST